uniref:UBA domain-containing protein n=1 Tax=Meloidogyne hapla TaxID=6305 RepID=A0A1I8BWH6_MELHA
MDEGEDQMHKVAIQAFKEFTGNQDELTARRLLLSCNWDVQRAINIFFMRGAPPQPIEEHKNDEKDEDIVVDEDDEIQAIQPSFEPKKRISHFVKRNKNFVEKIQTAEDKKQNKIDDNSEDNIRAPIPAVKGVMLAQTFRETYGLFFNLKLENFGDL